MNGSKWIDDPDIIEGYLRDASNIEGFATQLFRPETAEDVAEILCWCSTQDVSITVSGCRTSTTGAATPIGGAILSMECFNTIHSVSEVDANVMLGTYQNYLASRQMCFPPDPTSRHECSIGGAISCNASGARSFYFGSIRSWVDAVEVVFPTGEIRIVDRQTPFPSNWPSVSWALPRVKTSAGYQSCDNLLDLLIGQEGTLGVITKAWLRTIPTFEVYTVVAFFNARQNCLHCTNLMREQSRMDGVQIYSVEYFDRNAIGFMKSRLPHIPDAACGLIIEFDEENMSSVLEILESSNALSEYTMLEESTVGQEMVQQARHAIPAGINEQLVRNHMPKVGTDFAVPFERLTWMMDAYDEVDVPKVLFGHIGDAHLHLNMLPRTASELEYARELYVELARIALSYGGTVSAEHGIGKIKRQLLAEMVGPETIRTFQELKKVVDPAWILGRGNIFDRLL
jgi:D-lactate dehydrogenase (cytochrome)